MMLYILRKKLMNISLKNLVEKSQNSTFRIFLSKNNLEIIKLLESKGALCEISNMKRLISISARVDIYLEVKKILKELEMRNFLDFEEAAIRWP
jgi:hypothetical protein